MPRRRRGTNKDENTFVIVRPDRTIQIIWIPAFAGMTLKNRLKKEGSEVVTKCDQLKIEASDGKKYLTDALKPSTGDKLSPVENDGRKCRFVLSW